MSNRDFAKHNGLIAFIAILLVLILVGGIIGGLYYFNRCLFGHDYDENGVCTRCGAEKPDEVQEAPEDMAGGMGSESGVNAGIALLSMNISRDEYLDYGIMAIAESAKQLTATVSPATATDNKLDWSVEFVNPSSEWATGKNVTDYVTVTPTADGALTANVQCLKAFGEQIIVVAHSRQDPGIWGTATVDYVKRVNSINLTLAPNAATFGATYNVTATPVYSDGTLTGTFTQTSYSAQLAESISTAIQSVETDFVGYYKVVGGYNKIKGIFTFDSLKSSSDLAGNTWSLTGSDAFDACGSSKFSNSTGGSWSGHTPTSQQEAESDTLNVLRNLVNNKFLEAVKAENGNHITFSLGYTYNYSGVVSDSKTVTYGLRLDPSSLVVHVTGITFDKNLVF